MRTRGSLMLAACCAAAVAQPSFEVADVKANSSGETAMAVDFQGGARFMARNVPMRILIALAYHVRPDAVTGGPGWLGSSRYDILAKGSQKASSDEIRLMLQSLLRERFLLAVHREQKSMAAFALETVRGGPTMKASADAPLSEQRCLPGEAPPGGKQVSCRHMTMAVLADVLQEVAGPDLDVPVVDRTGVVGSFDFELVWSPNLTDGSAAGRTIFEAVEAQLGLRLRRTTALLPVIVVDGVERAPKEN